MDEERMENVARELALPLTACQLRLDPGPGKAAVGGLVEVPKLTGEPPAEDQLPTSIFIDKMRFHDILLCIDW